MSAAVPSPFRPSNHPSKEEEADPSIPLSDPSPIHPSLHPSKEEEEESAEEAVPSIDLDWFSEEEEEEEEADPSIHPSMFSADPSIPLSMRYEAVAAQPSLAAPWLFYQSHSNPGEISAIYCLSHPDSAPEVHRFPLPAELAGYSLVASTGHSLLLQKGGRLSRLCLFNPFSASPLFKSFFPSTPHIATLPPSPSPIPRHAPPHVYFYIRTLVIDPDSRIALALSGDHYCRLAYTMLPNTGNCWINLTHLIPNPPDGRILFQSAVLCRKGLFCAVDRYGDVVLSFDFSHDVDSPSMSDLTHGLPSHRKFLPSTGRSHWRCCQSATLIASRSSLFLVRWRTYAFPSDTPLPLPGNTSMPLTGKITRDGVSKHRVIDIYSLDFGAQLWAPVDSLGDRSFFIGHTKQSFSISTADFPELQPNRVYISNDATRYIAGGYDGYDSDDDDDPLATHLFYDLQTKSWSSFYHYRLQCPSLWMMPAARRDAS